MRLNSALWRYISFKFMLRRHEIIDRWKLVQVFIKCADNCCSVNSWASDLLLSMFFVHFIWEIYHVNTLFRICPLIEFSWRFSAKSQDIIKPPCACLISPDCNFTFHEYSKRHVTIRYPRRLSKLFLKVLVRLSPVGSWRRNGCSYFIFHRF